MSNIKVGISVLTSRHHYEFHLNLMNLLKGWKLKPKFKEVLLEYLNLDSTLIGTGNIRFNKSSNKYVKDKLGLSDQSLSNYIGKLLKLEILKREFITGHLFIREDLEKVRLNYLLVINKQYGTT